LVLPMRRTHRFLACIFAALAILAIGCAPNARYNTAPHHAGTDGGGMTVPVGAPTTHDSRETTRGYGRHSGGWKEVMPSEAGALGGMKGAERAPAPKHEAASKSDHQDDGH